MVISWFPFILWTGDHHRRRDQKRCWTTNQKHIPLLDVTFWWFVSLCELENGPVESSWVFPWIAWWIFPLFSVHQRVNGLLIGENMGLYDEWWRMMVDGWNLCFVVDITIDHQLVFIWFINQLWGGSIHGATTKWMWMDGLFHGKFLENGWFRGTPVLGNLQNLCGTQGDSQIR